jgi:hypothetical protein
MTRPEGLQAERTRLAWHRSALAGGLVALLLVHAALVRREPVVAAAGLTLWLLLALATRGRIRAMTDPRPGAPRARTVVLPAVVVLGFAAVATAAVLLP